MFALLVNGGDSTSLKGVFSTREQIDPIIAEVARDASCTEDDGFTTSDAVKCESDHRKTYVHVFEDSMEDWSLLFTIIEVTVDQQLDIDV